ncbi:MAG: hypothetical protein K2G93_00870, partial [Rikenella sp.]|nr:hypothetical protein [Rikenella sp.]
VDHPTVDLPYTYRFHGPSWFIRFLPHPAKTVPPLLRKGLLQNYFRIFVVHFSIKFFRLNCMVLFNSSKLSKNEEDT